MWRSTILSLALVSATVSCNKGESEQRQRELAELEQARAAAELAKLQKEAAEAKLAEATRVPAPAPNEPPPVPAAAPTPKARPVTITVSVAVAPRKPDGNPWDPMGNAPDPVLKLMVGDDSWSLGPFKDHASARATFPPVMLTPGDSISIKVTDNDMQQHDLIGVFTTEFQAKRTVQGKLEGGTISVTFD